MEKGIAMNPFLLKKKSLHPKENRYILILVAISLSSMLFYAPKYGLIYDGGLYASLGYSLYKNQEYTFNDSLGDVPPLFPAFLAAFILFLGERGIVYAAPLMCTTFVAVSYLLLRREFKNLYAFLGALLILFSPLLFFYSVNVVPDSMLLIFVMLSYLLYFELVEKESKAKSTALGFSIACAVLTKYAGAAYIAPILIYGAAKRHKFLITSAATALAILSPWFLWLYLRHGSFTSHYDLLLPRIGENMRVFFMEAIPQFARWSFLPAFILSILGMNYRRRSAESSLYLLLFIFTITAALIWPVKIARYILPALFPVVYFSLRFLYSFKRVALLFLVAGIAFQGFATIDVVGYNIYSNSLLENAGYWLRDSTPENARIATQSYRQIHFFSHRRTFELPREEHEIRDFIKANNISYAVVDTYEKLTPSYAYTYFNKFKLLKTFSGRGSEVNIYDLSQPGYLTVVLSFDVETRYCIAALPEILNMLKKHNATATFFVTGKIAERYPDAIRRLSEGGYEIGSHGYVHEYPIFNEEDAREIAEKHDRTFEYIWNRSAKSEEEYRIALLKSNEAIKNATGKEVKSYRSPLLAPSIAEKTKYLDILRESGFEIDSSLLRRYSGINEPKVAVKGVTIVPASFSDAQFSNLPLVFEYAKEHYKGGLPLVIFVHPWKLRDNNLLAVTEEFLSTLEKRYNVRYATIEEIAHGLYIQTSP